MPETRNSGERRRFFVPKAKLLETKVEIEKLLKQSQSGRLRPREQRRLAELRSLTRREFLKKVTVGIGAVAGVGLAGREFFAPEPQTQPVETKSESKAETQEKKMKPVDVIKSVIASYNHWLDALAEDEVEKAKGIAKFVEIYNAKIKDSDEPISEISLNEFEKTGNPESFFQQIQPLQALLAKYNYFIKITPTGGSWKGERISYMAVLFGEIKNRERRHLSRRGQKTDYEHIVIDHPEGHEYRTGPAAFTAVAFEDRGKQVVLQDVAGYTKSANTVYESLRHPPETEKALAVRAAFAQYLTNDKTSSINAIRDQLMQTSLIHEEQHVLDGNTNGVIDGIMDEKSVPKYMIIEMRGLLAPFLGKNPKVALENVFNWTTMSDQIRQLVGTMTLGILSDIADKDSEGLINATDEELRDVGRKAMDYSDIIYKSIVTEGKLFDQTVNQEYYKFLDEIRSKKR